MSDVLDAEIVSGTDIAVVDASPALFRTSDPVEVLSEASRVAKTLKDVLHKQGMVSDIQGRTHVTVEGWQTLGAMLGVTAVCVHTERLDDGWLATVEARRADGMVAGRADAICTKAEKRWSRADDYALLSMAQTRATSKALKGPLGFVVKIAGYDPTPAEEMPADTADARVLSSSQLERMFTAVRNAGLDLTDVLVTVGASRTRVTVEQSQHVKNIIDAKGHS
jgi:hypothetical protein